MNKIKAILIFFISLVSFSVSAQVAIGTTTPDDGSAFEINSTSGAFVPPRMTDTQMQAIPTPLQGAMVYNTTKNSLFTFNGTEWLLFNGSLPTILFNRGQNGSLTLGDDDYYHLPVDDTYLTYNDSDYYEVISIGKIKTLKDGIYSIKAGLSTSNLRSGNRKYVLSVKRNGALIGYLVRGQVNLSSNDYWGTSGVLSFQSNANDVIEVEYVLNRDSGATSDQTALIRFVDLSIVKIK